MNDKFQLVKKRDLGDIIQNAITFLSHAHAQPLWRSILLYVLPVYMIAGFFVGQFNIDMQEVLPDLQSGGITDPSEAFAALSKIFGFHYYMVLIASLVANGLLTAFTYNFIAAYYHSQSGEVDGDAIRSSAFSDILWIIGFNILTGIIVGIGIMFFFFPGIYFAIILSILLVVAKVENLSFGDAFTRCRELVKDNWWNTFLILLVVGLLTGIASLVIGSILQAILLIFGKYVGMVLASVLQNAIAGAISVFTIMTISLQYFNLRANSADHTMAQDIEEIGIN